MENRISTAVSVTIWNLLIALAVFQLCKLLVKSLVIMGACSLRSAVPVDVVLNVLEPSRLLEVQPYFDQSASSGNFVVRTHRSCSEVATGSH